MTRWRPAATSGSPTPTNRRRCCWRARQRGRAPREIVTFNAGAALYAANVARFHRGRHRQAREVLASGARAPSWKFVACTRKLA
jgi:anthranilate phosphoribosyltransferase